MTSRRLFIATAILATAFAGTAMAQDPAATYPDKPVRLIAGSSPGGTADLVARLIADNLSKKLNGRFVVENVPGNSGGIASVQVARAAPDGYTLMLAAINSHAILPALNKTLQYDPIKRLRACLADLHQPEPADGQSEDRREDDPRPDRRAEERPDRSIITAPAASARASISPWKSSWRRPAPRPRTFPTPAAVSS